MDQKTFKYCIFILPWFRVNNEIFSFDVVILEMNIKYVNYKQPALRGKWPVFFAKQWV